MSKKRADKASTKFDYGSNQTSNTTNNTINNTTITKQPLKQPVLKSLYCECNELCYPFVYDQNDNIIGKLFPCCRINVVENNLDHYITDTGGIIEKGVIGVRWKQVPYDKSGNGYINKYSGHYGEDLFAEILTDLGYVGKQLDLNEPFADFFVVKNGKYYLIRLKSHLSEHSPYVELDDCHLNGLIEWVKSSNVIPVLVNYYPHTNSFIAVDVRTNKKIELYNKYIFV